MPLRHSGGGAATTRGLALDMIRAARTISRVELAAGLGLTSPAVTRIVRDLLVEGLVRETGRGPSTGGKPRTLLQIDPRSRYGVGVHLERNTCVITVVDLAGEPVCRTVLPGAAEVPPERMLPRLADEIHALLAATGVDKAAVVGLGLVTYGPQDWRSGVLLTPQPNPQWLDYPVARRMADLVQLPVLLDNDANAAAIGEYWLGTVDLTSTYGCIYLGTGIGGGVVVAGEVYRGSSANAVEIGHISVDVDGAPCTCGNNGCLERSAGPEAVVRQAWTTSNLARRLGLDPKGRDPQGGDFLVDFSRITTAASSGDPMARSLVERSARHLGGAAVTLTNLFDLDFIVLAGPGFGSAASIYRSIIQNEVDRRWFSRRAHPVRVVTSANGSDAAAIGGAALILQRELVRPRAGSSGDRTVRAGRMPSQS
ncbi:ROK family transcriptional regulator [Micromonospora sp. NPDC023956]|uniref:ROK family transcriptional regulator n=1 Tax=Micromonospora sp. NPDC023956 TaxID=3155722 RepID=UPI0033C6CF4E